MRIALRRDHQSPLNEQIAEQIRAAIAAGSLRRGHRLASARELASDLGVNRLTVESAFARLERAGLIERRHGSGTFVLPSFARRSPEAGTAVGGGWPAWQRGLVDHGTGRGDEPVLRYDFSGGMGDGRLIPVTEFRRVLQRVVRTGGADVFGYAEPQGFRPLREAIAEILCSQGLPATADNILITTGAQQAISLAARALLAPGDTILVENPCYDSALGLFRLLGLRIVAAPMDEDGVRPDAVEAILRTHRPKLMYCMPNYQNPTGRLLGTNRRHALVELAARYNLPILEDDYVGELRYDGTAEPCLKTLDRRGGVIYTSTFSKMLMPGLRLGFIMAEGPVLAHLVTWKRYLEIGCPAVLQRALHAFVSVGRYRRHVRKSRQVYGARRDAMVAALRKHLPPGAGFETPKGGFFVWVKLPRAVNRRELAVAARERGVGFADGGRFVVERSGRATEHIRLNFAMREIPEIEAGIRILGSLISRDR